MKSEGWAPLWVDADSKKCQICVVQMTKKPGTYTLSIIHSINPRNNFAKKHDKKQPDFIMK